MKKRSTKAVVDEIVTRDVGAIARGVPVEEATTRTPARDALQDVVTMLPVDVGPADALEPPEVATRRAAGRPEPQVPRPGDFAPAHAAAEAAGLRVSDIEVGARITVRCGPHVPTFTGATVAEVVAKIAAYNCKYCGTGGGHTPNCGRPK